MTSVVVLVAVVLVGWKFSHYYKNPWTRNGRVMAQVMQISPRVSGTLVQLPVADNQFVTKGDLLFEIDPRTFQSTLDGMRGLLAETEDEIEALGAQAEATARTIGQYDAAIKRAEQAIKGRKARLQEVQYQLVRYRELVKTGAGSVERVERAEADVADAEALVVAAQAELRRAEALKREAKAKLARDLRRRGTIGAANARRQTAKARVHSAELELEFTEVRAPVDGYVTNLELRLGDHATADKPILALVDVSTYWVYGYFKELYLEDVQAGDRAIVTLMGYPDTPIEARVAARGWGVYQEDGSTAHRMLPKISATYEWTRLPQRVPVRIEFDTLPEGVKLMVGATASVVIMTGTAGSQSGEPLAAAPQALQ